MTDPKKSSTKTQRRVDDGMSSTFKTTSRDKKASWGNRFVHDHNDLYYEADPLKQKTKRHQPQPQNPQVGSHIQKYQYSPLKQRQMPRSSQSQRVMAKMVDIEKYIRRTEDTEAMKKVNETAATSMRTRFIEERDNVEVEPFNDGMKGRERSNRVKKVRIEEIPEEVRTSHRGVSPNPKSVNLLGLSQFQYAATIQGKILSKSNHHLDLQRDRTKRINNTHKPWYNHSKPIQKPQEILAKEKIHTLERYHSFKSDSAHQLFRGGKRMSEDNGCGYGGMLDKYYEVGPYEVNHFRITKDLVDYRVMTARPDLRGKLGTNLEYKTEEVLTMGVGSPKRPIMQLSHSPRRLIFSRQVISPTRGCYR